MSTTARVRLFLIAIVVVLAVVRYPAVRWFVVVSVLLGALAAMILHFVNQRPVKIESDEVRLHLLDDDDTSELKR